MASFYLFIISTVLPIVVVGFFWAKTSKHYLKLYRKKINPVYPLSIEEIKQKYYHDSFRFILSLPYLLKTRWVIFWESHQDKELNSLAVKLRGYFYLIALIMVANFIIRTIFSSL